MRIGENIGELKGACKRPSIKTLELELNGIEPEYCLYLPHLINFETLESLNLSNNWIRMVGLERIKDNFASFKTLKVLKLESNKLFQSDYHRTEDLSEILFYVSKTIQELYISANAMRDEDMQVLIPALVKIPNLKVLDLNKNIINGSVIKEFLDAYLAKKEKNGLSLETLNISSNILTNEETLQILELTHRLENLKHINLNANKITAKVGPSLLSFLADFSLTRQLTVDFRMQDMKRVEV